MHADTRQPVMFDRDTMRLSIGDQSTIVPEFGAGNEAMLRSYLALVAEVRGTPIGSGIEVRHDDVVVLAEILDLTDTELDNLLAVLLGVSAEEAAAVHGRLRRHRALAAAASVAIGSIALLGATNVSARTRPGRSRRTWPASARASPKGPPPHRRSRLLRSRRRRSNLRRWPPLSPHRCQPRIRRLLTTSRSVTRW